MGKRWACKPTATRLLEIAGAKTAELAALAVTPHLAVVLVGGDPASRVYVQKKIETCESLGIKSTHVSLPHNTTTATLLEKLDILNRDPTVHGILVQLPLPPQIDESLIIAAVDPEKDVDGFHPVNVGRLSQGEPGLFPCTPMGIMELLKDCGLPLMGKHAVVVGRSNIVGKPMAQLLLKAHCSVTVVHSRTPSPQVFTRQADLVIVAVGRAGLVDGSWLKEGALVVDVGMNQITDPAQAARLIPEGSRKMAEFKEHGRALYGDVYYRSALEVAARVTPVPGGVGKLTIAHLMLNCVTAASRSVGA